jgi:hypothetical protein
MTDSTGLTKDVGWELGVRRTASAPLETTWAFLTGEGLGIWLGETELPSVAHEPYETTDGTHGELRSRIDGQRVRLTWQPAGWEHDSTLQLTVLPAAFGTTIAFHQERLAGPDEREAMLAHWTAVAERLVEALDAE